MFCVIRQDSVHKGIKYQCDECDYQATQEGNLKVHKQSKHLELKYPCSLCDYQATAKRSLTRHIKSVHEKFDKKNCGYKLKKNFNDFNDFKL